MVVLKEGRIVVDVEYFHEHVLDGERPLRLHQRKTQRTLRDSLTFLLWLFLSADLFTVQALINQQFGLV